MRYEDLCTNPTEELTGMMKFLLDLDDLSGTNMERRINQIDQMGSAATKTYKLKSTTGRFNASYEKYTKDQIELVKKEMAEWIYFFGYAKKDSNPTGFFDFENPDATLEDKHYGFRKTN